MALRFIQATSKLSISILLLIIPPTFAAQLLVEPDAGRTPLLAAIHSAQTNLDLAIYGFTDPAFLDALNTAKQHSRAVRILIQHYPFMAKDENTQALNFFGANHLSYAFPDSHFYLIHQKTLIIDHRQAWVLSFNLTRSTFEKLRNFGVLITNPAMVAEIQKVYDADWQHQSVTPTHPDLVWSPDSSRMKILGMIGEAQHELKVYCQGLSDYEVIGALAAAAKRGVAVQVITSDLPKSGKLNYMRRAGVRFHVDHELRIHAKVLVVDGKKMLIGSINFTRASMDRNRELGVIVKEPALVASMLRVFERDWNSL